MTISNYLTFGRLILTPIFLLCYLYQNSLGISEQLLPFVLLCLLGISEASDFLDGFLARRLKQVTDFGKIVDPLADSIAHTTVFLAFSQGVVQLPIIIAFIFLYRDSVVSTLRTACALHGTVLAARWSGKIKAATQGVAAFMIVLLMIPHAFGYIATESLHLYATLFASFAAIISLLSLMDYLYVNREMIQGMLKRRSS
ncbi:MAG: CDP-diacylglycerol--glycerol-3-phosphate 3-phosphatidyltransferase [Waddliaceae bacterium]|nr:CDP-diacylglycerol--glycerol-3-phosphate 3-phosphatidyltransferase [Waddliaceae bacterium]